MAALLYRLGVLAARRARLVLGSWLVLLALGVGAYLSFGGTLTNSFDIPGTASGAVTDELAEKLPDTAGGTGTVVYATDDGSAFTDEQRTAISELAASATELTDVAAVIDPFETQAQLAAQTQQLADGRAAIESGSEQLEAARALLPAGSPELAALESAATELAAQSEQVDLGTELLGYSDGIGVVSADESTAIVNVSFDVPRLELAEASKQGVIEHFEATPIDGVHVDFGTDVSQGVPQIFGVGEVVGLIFACIVLVVMLGSFLAASFPLITALVGVGVGVTGSLAFSGTIDMASVTPVLGVMLGLAVGIDYALFIVNRHRRQVLDGAELRESIGLANGTAGNAVVFAGSTVIVALLALNVTGVPFLGLMGTVGAVCVAVAVLIAVTLVPALLGLAGERIVGRRARARAARGGAASGKPAAPIRPMSTLRAVLTAVGTVVVLLAVAIPALSMRLGLPDGSGEPSDSTAYAAYTEVEEQFGAGANGPLLVTAELPAGLDDTEKLQAQVDVAGTIAGLDAVTAIAPIAVSDDGTLAAFQVLPEEGPNSVSTDALVREIRDLPPVSGEYALGVAGQAATNIDISEGLADVLPLYLLVVVGLSLVIMIVVFRSLLVPVIATGGFVLSLLGTYGLVTAVFQFGWGASLIGLESTGPILSFLPVILVGILFGLAMDYQLFLATGMREAYVHGSEARLAVAQGFRAGRSVVIAAALIMVSVFGGFIFSHSTIIRSMGFGLAFGVLLDAFLVRMLLMPALMHLLGRSAWWLPRWLDRLLPDVDVEGAALERQHPTGAHAPSHPAG